MNNKSRSFLLCPPILSLKQIMEVGGRCGTVGICPSQAHRDLSQDGVHGNTLGLWVIETKLGEFLVFLASFSLTSLQGFASTPRLHAILCSSKSFPAILTPICTPLHLQARRLIWCCLLPSGGPFFYSCLLAVKGILSPDAPLWASWRESTAPHWQKFPNLPHEQCSSNIF